MLKQRYIQRAAPETLGASCHKLQKRKTQKTKRKIDTKAAAPNSATSSDCRDSNTRFPSRKTAQGHAWDWQLLGNQKKARSPTQKSQREQARVREARGDGGKKQATTNKQTNKSMP